MEPKQQKIFGIVLIILGILFLISTMQISSISEQLGQTDPSAGIYNIFSVLIILAGIVLTFQGFRGE
jgi:hypothetical protein